MRRDAELQLPFGHNIDLPTYPISLKKLFKPFINAPLAYFNRRLAFAPHRGITGFDLEDDLKFLLPDSPVCLDVGANEGQTISLLKRCTHDATIFSFEPDPRIFDKLNKAYSRDRSVYTFNCALGSEQGNLMFNLHEMSVLNSCLPFDKDAFAEFPEDSPHIRQVSVEVNTVDHIAASHSIDTIDLLKIDTQGYELPVLQGANCAFARKGIQHVLVELNFVDLYVGQSPWNEVHDLLLGHGFRLVDFYEKRRGKDHDIIWCTALYKQRS